MKTLYVHIGANKTGTTAIQNVLEKSKEALALQGFCYPDQGKIWNGHFKLAWEIGAGGTEEQKKQSVGQWRRLGNSIKESKFDKFIVSSENFILVDSAEQLMPLREALGDNVHVKIVLYVRRQDIWLESLYLQAIKMGVSVGTFSDFVRRPGQELDFFKILRPWETVFEKNNILVSSYDESKDRLLQSFLELVGADPAGFDTSVTANPSLTRDCAEMILAHWETIAGQKKICEFIKFWSGKIDKSLEVNPYFLPRQARVEFLNRFSEGNRRVANTYLSRPELFDYAFLPDGVEELPEKRVCELRAKCLNAFIQNF